MCNLGAAGVERYPENERQREASSLSSTSKDSHFCAANATCKATPLAWLVNAIAAGSD